MHNNNPFPGRKIKLSYLPNGNIRIIWKHPENSLLERIAIGLLSISFSIYCSYFIRIIIKSLIEIISDFIRYHTEKFHFIAFIFGILSLLIAIVIFSFWLCVSLYPVVRMLLNLVVAIKGTGTSKLFLDFRHRLRLVCLCGINVLSNCFDFFSENF
ncbi:MAG: hypothetical protein AAFR37_07250, partial [Cyanobacteria bacterium J06628_3]